MPNIVVNRVTKNEKEKEFVHDEQMQKMQIEIEKVFQSMMVKQDQFEKEKTFDDLYSYILAYDRILYSPISNLIYSSYENGQDGDVIGTLQSNLDALLSYVSNPQVIENKKSDLKDAKSKKRVDDTKKAIIKIWDHVNLANQQYKVLKQTDDEYNKKFQVRIADYKETMTKEMNAQLLTLVSIFTALAFLVFGGISSLDNIFSLSEIPLLKIIASGLVWGLCIFNLIFVFLFCVGKMTHLNFKSTDSPDATIFQKYPIVWWCDLLLVSLLLICLWLYFMQREEISIWFINICVKNTELSSVIGTIMLLGVIIFMGWRLAIATNIIIGKGERNCNEKRECISCEYSGSR